MYNSIKMVDSMKINSAINTLKNTTWSKIDWITELNLGNRFVSRYCVELMQNKTGVLL